MTLPDLHLCIATGQNLANLIPALQCGAREVWILQTPGMQASAGHLTAALKRRKVECKRVDFPDDDVAAMHTKAEDIAVQLDGRPVTINVTGGTKKMTLALVQTLAAQLATGSTETAPHLVYTDTEHGRLDWLAPVPRSDPMQDVLGVDDVLFAQGYRRKSGSGPTEAADWQRAAQGREELTRYLGDEVRALERFFGVLNALAQRALNERPGVFEREQSLELPVGGKPAVVLGKAMQHGLIHWDEDTQIVFHDPAAAAYLGGGWVEEYAALKIRAIARPGRWEPRLRVEHVDSHAENELDAVVMHGNRMLVVECKAARPGEKTADWIYRISQLSRSIGGQMARPLLLSARALGEEHLARAREYGVDVLDGARLAELSGYLRKWMAG